MAGNFLKIDEWQQMELKISFTRFIT